FGGLGDISGPPRTPTTPEKRHGCAGALRTFGGLGATSGPARTPTTPEGRHGCARALRTFGGLGAISWPPSLQAGGRGPGRLPAAYVHAALVLELFIEALERHLARGPFPELRGRRRARQDRIPRARARKRGRHVGVQRRAIAGVRLLGEVGQR